MGVRGLFSFLKQRGRTSNLTTLCALPPQRIGIDISYYLYKWQGDMGRVLNLLDTFKEKGHQVLVVFDGKAEDAKQSESKRRKDSRNEELKSASAILDLLNSNETELSEEQRAYLMRVASEHEKRGWQLTREIRHSVKKTLYEHKIPLLKAVGEADSLLTALAIEEKLNIIISGDMDLLVLGTPQLYVPQKDGLDFIMFDRRRLLHSLGITDDQFRTFCALSSSEYGSSSQSLDIRKSYHGIRVYGTMTALKESHADWLQEWPPQDHCFFRDHSKSEPFLREDEKDRLQLFLDNKEMPYC